MPLGPGIPEFYYRALYLSKEIIELEKQFPNDQDLGAEIRKAIAEHKNPRPNPHFELDETKPEKE